MPLANPGKVSGAKLQNNLSATGICEPGLKVTSSRTFQAEVTFFTSEEGLCTTDS